MNYGTVDEKAIVRSNPDRINEMLQFKMSDKGLKAKQDYIEEETDDIENYNMTKGNSPNQIGIAAVSIFMTAIISVPIFLIAFVNFAIELLVLGLAVLLPFSFILSFIPRFANVAWVVLGRLITMFLCKAFVAFIVLFVFLIIDIVNVLIPVSGTGMYLLNGLVQAVGIFCMIKYRNSLIKLISAGKVTSVDGNVLGKAYDHLIKEPTERVKDSVQAVAKTAVGFATGGPTGATAGAMSGISEMKQRAEQRKEQRMADGREMGQPMQQDEGTSPIEQGSYAEGRSNSRLVMEEVQANALKVNEISQVNPTDKATQPLNEGENVYQKPIQLNRKNRTMQSENDVENYSNVPNEEAPIITVAQLENQSGDNLSSSTIENVEPI
ncbi:hypothetical protein WAX46_12645 [Bacillus sp. FJAT-53060]